MLDYLKENFYLSDKEARVYLASLQLGRSKTSHIAKKASLNRITTYEVLKRLYKRGLASSAMYNNVLTFKVVEPKILYKKMEQRLELAKQAISQLNTLSGLNKTKPKIEFYEGKEGIRTIYQDTLNCRNKVILNIANPKNLLTTIGSDYFSEYVKKRVRRKILVKVLLPDSPEYAPYKKEKKTALRQIKFFDNQRYRVPNEILIYDNKVAMLSFVSKIGIIIQDDDMVQSVQNLWSMVWNNL